MKSPNFILDEIRERQPARRKVFELMEKEFNRQRVQATLELEMLNVTLTDIDFLLEYIKNLEKENRNQ